MRIVAFFFANNLYRESPTVNNGLIVYRGDGILLFDEVFGSIIGSAIGRE